MSTTLDVNDLDALGAAIKGQSDAAILDRAAASPGGVDAVLDGLMERMRASFKPEVAGGARAVLRYDVKTADGTRSYEFHMADRECRIVHAADANARSAISLSAPDVIRMFCGQLNLLAAFMKRRMKVKGDLKFVKDVGSWFGMLDVYTGAG